MTEIAKPVPPRLISGALRSPPRVASDTLNLSQLP